MKKLFIAIILFAILFIGSIPIFTVKSAKLQNRSSCLEEEILLSRINKKNLILLDTEKLKEEIKKQLVCVEDIKITKKYPNTVIFEVLEKKAVAQIDGSPNSVTADGLVILESSPSLKPKLFLPQPVENNIGQKIKDPSVLFALQLLKSLEKSDFIPSSVRIVEQGDVAVYSTKEAVALFTEDRSVDLQVDSLQSVIAKAKIDPSKIAKIDLRFDKPVLIYK
jgi:cell division septal protein FtsQ